MTAMPSWLGHIRLSEWTVHQAPVEPGELTGEECGHCQKPLLTTSPSPDFCGELCQRAWHAQRPQVARFGKGAS